MDLLSKRYANPCFLLNGMIQTGRLEEFVTDVLDMVNQEQEEQTMWDYYLHRALMYEGSFNDFVTETRASAKTTRDNATMSERNLETTIQRSMDILKRFNHEQEGE